MKKYAVIVAGGSGTRLGGSVPKQFQELNGRPLLWWSLQAFHYEDPATEIILVLPEAHIKLWEKLFSELPPEEKIPHSIAFGGTTRTESVKNGLASVSPRDDALVAVHDGARPLVSRQMIRQGWECACEKKACVPVVPVNDSLRLIAKDEEESRAVDRSIYVAVQTPQVFSVTVLKKAYASNPDATYSDDAAAVEAMGEKIALYDGETTNIKVTNPGDLEIAGLYLKKMNG